MVATDPVKNKILVVGSVPHSRSLINQIIGKEDVEFTSLYDDEIQRVDWAIDTKYYSADVDFWVLNQHHYPPAQLPLPVDELGDLCEALILVFDSTKHETFERLHPWTDFVEKFAPSVLLCVGIGKCEDKRVYNEWCVDNGIEFVEIIEPSVQNNNIPESNTNLSSNSSNTNGDDDNDGDEDDNPFGSGTEGKERIIEALGATMWTNMRQKERRVERTLEDRFSDALSLHPDLHNNDNPDLPDLSAFSNYPAPAPTFDPLNFDEDLRLARGEFPNDGLQHTTSEIAQNLRSLQSFLRETEPAEDGDDISEGTGREAGLFGDTEFNVEQFESALTGLRRLREGAQQLPDAQRKALAAQVVSMLFPGENWEN